MFNKFNDQFMEDSQKIHHDCERWDNSTPIIITIVLIFATLCTEGGYLFIPLLIATILSGVLSGIFITLSVKADLRKNNYKYRNYDSNWWVLLNRKGTQYLGYTLDKEDVVAVSYYKNGETILFKYNLYDYLADDMFGYTRNDVTSELKYLFLSDPNLMHLASIYETYSHIEKNESTLEKEGYDKKIATIWAE